MQMTREMRMLNILLLAYGCEEVRFQLPIEAVDTTRFVLEHFRGRADRFP